MNEAAADESRIEKGSPAPPLTNYRWAFPPPPPPPLSIREHISRFSVLFKRAIRITLEAAYYLLVLIFGLLVAATVFSLIAGLFDALNSFLISPIGIKPDHMDTGFGSMALPLFICTVISGVAYRIAKYAKSRLQRDAIESSSKA